MKLKIFFDDIEIGLPTNKKPKQIEANLEGMLQTFSYLVENTELLERLKITETNG